LSPSATRLFGGVDGVDQDVGVQSQPKQNS